MSIVGEKKGASERGKRKKVKRGKFKGKLKLNTCKSNRK
jgi:hypothetical protein